MHAPNLIYKYNYDYIWVMNIRYYIAVLFVFFSTVVYGPRVDLSDGSTEPAPAWFKFLAIIFWLWVFFVYMRDDKKD